MDIIGRSAGDGMEPWQRVLKTEIHAYEMGVYISIRGHS